jgi:hypothetical protein
MGRQPNSRDAHAGTTWLESSYSPRFVHLSREKPDIPSRLISALVRVTRGKVASDLCAFFETAADDHVGGRGTGAIALKIEIATVEACHHLIVALPVWCLGIDQGLCFVPPFLAFVAVANALRKLILPEVFEPVRRQGRRIERQLSPTSECRCVGWRSPNGCRFNRRLRVRLSCTRKHLPHGSTNRVLGPDRYCASRPDARV